MWTTLILLSCSPPSDPSRRALPRAGSRAPRPPHLLLLLPRCPLPFPSAPQTLLPGSALLPPPSLRGACLLPPLREASHRPDPEEDASPSPAVIRAQHQGCHRAPQGRAPSVLASSERRRDGAHPTGPLALASSPAALLLASRGTASRPPGGRRHRPRRPPG